LFAEPKSGELRSCGLPLVTEHKERQAIERSSPSDVEAIRRKNQLQLGFPLYILSFHTRPTDTPMKIVQILKSISARRIREEFLDILQQYIWKEGTFLAAGYYIASIADGITTEVVQEYIRNQKKRNSS